MLKPEGLAAPEGKSAAIAGVSTTYNVLEARVLQPAGQHMHIPPLWRGRWRDCSSYMVPAPACA